MNSLISPPPNTAFISDLVIVNIFPKKNIHYCCILLACNRFLQHWQKGTVDLHFPCNSCKAVKVWWGVCVLCSLSRDSDSELRIITAFVEWYWKAAFCWKQEKAGMSQVSRRVCEWRGSSHLIERCLSSNGISFSMKGYCQVYTQKNVHIREIKQANSMFDHFLLCSDLECIRVFKWFEVLDKCSYAVSI